MGERIRRAGAVAWALVGLAAVLALVGLVAWVFRVIWPPLILAGAIVFILNPVVSRLQRQRIPRVAGTALAYLAILAVFVLAGLVVRPLVTDQADELREE